jgi:membrane protease YdiL (CAAX protease family)
MARFDRDHPLLAMAREGRRLPNVFLALIVLVGMALLAFCLPTIGASIAFGGDARAAAFTEGNVFIVISFALLVVLLWIWTTAYERRPFRTLGLPAAGWLVKLLGGLAAGFGMIALIVGLMALAGGVVRDGGGEHRAGAAALGAAFLPLLVFGIQGPAEELLFRGWLLPVIGARHRLWLGVAVSTLVFAGFHGTLNPMALVSLLLFSLFTAAYCLREGGVWGVCGWHAAWNWTQGHFFGLSVSGHGQGGGTVLDLKAAGHPLVSGGTYGPEGSILCAVVLVAGIAALVWLPRRKAR